LTAAHPKSPPTARDSGCGTRFSSVSVEVTATTSESKLRKVTAVTVVQRFYRERLSQTRKGYNIRLTILGYRRERCRVLPLNIHDHGRADDHRPIRANENDFLTINDNIAVQI